LRFAEALAHSCARALRETVAGVILHGSLTLADYLPGRSDVDLLVVDDPLTDAQVAALTEAAVAHRRQAPGRVDLRVVPAELIGEVPAEWALGRDPTRRVVRDTLHRRRGDPTRSIDPAQVARLLAVVGGRLAEARDGS
jgi:nucleotidyltransferase-like protein